MHSKMEKSYKKILITFLPLQPASINSLGMQENLNHIVY